MRVVLPLLCFLLWVAPVAAAKVATTQEVDRLQLLRLLEQGAVDQLERRLNELQADFETGRRSDIQVIRTYLAFANSDPALRKPLDAWVTQRPKSSAARQARGVYLGHLARLTFPYAAASLMARAKDEHDERESERRSRHQAAAASEEAPAPSEMPTEEDAA